MQNILRVSMTTLEVWRESASAAYERLGGRALTARILLDEVDPACDSMGRFNKVILAPGLLADIGASSGSRASVGGKSPLTGGIKEANVGGVVGAMLARLDLKAVVIEGKAQPGTWYTLHISPSGASLLPANDLSGLGVYETAACLREKYGSKVGIVTIGVAGEMRLTAASVAATDQEGQPGRMAARGGLGAVLGAKGVKAVVVDSSGARRTAAHDSAALKEALKAYHQVLRDTPQTAEVYPNFGTAAVVDLTNPLGGLPTRNFRSGQFEHAEDINGRAIYRNLKERGGDGVIAHACMPGCLIRCSNVYVDAQGRVLVSPLEYETIGMLGSNCGIGDLDAIARLNHLCNDVGVDTLDVGAALGIAMEAGLLPFGDAEQAADLIQQIGSGTILGRVLGCGAATMGRVLGMEHVPVAKGQALAAYEPRAIKGLGVTFATSPMGADHTAGNTIRANVDHRKPEGQIEASRRGQISAAMYDTLGLCLFAGPAVQTQFELLTDLLAGRYGWRLDEVGLLALGEETLRTELAFNRAAGLTPAFNRLPEYMSVEPNDTTDTVFDVPLGELARLHDTLD
jgi:aldehyde:ferredoxin oxidoreductase